MKALIVTTHCRRESRGNHTNWKQTERNGSKILMADANVRDVCLFIK